MLQRSERATTTIASAGFLWLIPQNAPTLKNATPNQQGRFNDAYSEFLRRLSAHGGNNPCAKLFGGLDNALKTLGKTNFAARSVSGGVAETKGSTIRIDPTKAFMDTSGSVSITTGYAYEGGQFTSLTIMLGNVEAAAFILAHEFAHRSNVKGFDQNDANITTLGGTQMDFAGARNNEMIRAACFSERTPQ